MDLGLIMDGNEGLPRTFEKWSPVVGHQLCAPWIESLKMAQQACGHAP